ncbi:MAG: hypothetical protein AD073_000323 [Mycoplasmataceae bacterium]|nr:MAG: hypothetical protein AD073_000323 [Mycoplasmataceae bacterium]
MKNNGFLLWLNKFKIESKIASLEKFRNEYYNNWME